MRLTDKRYAGPAELGDDRLPAGPAPGKKSLVDARYMPLQRKSKGPAAGGQADLPQPPGGGSPLPGDVRGKMETSFGADFSGVRVHEGPQAEDASAVAYTQGQDIVFAPGTYQPGSSQGQQLLGHELTHVVQQTNGRVAEPNAGGAPINEDPGLEAEADQQGERAARGDKAAVAGASRGVQRKVRARVIQRWKGRRTGKAFGKGLINAVIPVFSVKDFRDNWRKTRKGANPVYGESSSLRALVRLKEFSALVVALATAAATIMGIASVIAPPVAFVAGLCGLIATLAHAVTFVLRFFTVLALRNRIKTLRENGEIAAMREAEKEKWAELGGMIGNGIGVLFGGLGGAFTATTSGADNAKAIFGGENLMENMTEKISKKSAKNAFATGFGQIGNSLADVTGAKTEYEGGKKADTLGTIEAKSKITPKALKAAKKSLRKTLKPVKKDTEDGQKQQSEALDPKLAQDLTEKIGQAKEQGGNLEQKGQEVGNANPEKHVEGGDPNKLSDNDLKKLEQVDGESEGTESKGGGNEDKTDEKETDEKETDETKTEDGEQKSQDEQPNEGEQKKSQGEQKKSTEEDNNLEQQKQQLQQQQREGRDLEKSEKKQVDDQTGEDHEQKPQNDEQPNETKEKGKEDGGTDHEDSEHDENETTETSQKQETKKPTEQLPQVQKKSRPGVVQRKRSAHVVQRKLGFRRSRKSKSEKKKKPSWFRRKIIGRVKKAVAKAKDRLMRKMAKLFGIGKHADSAAKDVEKAKAGVGPAIAAEEQAREAAKETSDVVQEAHKKLDEKD